MNWKYKIRKEDDHYELVEDYPELDSYTEPLLVGDSKKDIHRQLLQMLQDTL